MPNAAPPDWVVREIARIHPDCRIGYEGGETYSLVELWPPRLANPMWGKRFEGHVFGPRFDPVSRMPLAITSVPIESVHDGSVLFDVRRMLTSGEQRRKNAVRAKVQAEQTQLDELAEQVGDQVWHNATRTGRTGSTAMARKHLTNDERRILSGEADEELKAEMLEAGR